VFPVAFNSTDTNVGGALFDNVSNTLMVTYTTAGPCAACSWAQWPPTGGLPSRCEVPGGCRNLWLRRCVCSNHPLDLMHTLLCSLVWLRTRVPYTINSPSGYRAAPPTWAEASRLLKTSPAPYGGQAMPSRYALGATTARCEAARPKPKFSSTSKHLLPLLYTHSAF